MTTVMNQKYLQYLTRNTWPVENSSPIARGEGIYFWDYEDKKYMDFSSQTLNLLFGQCHPVIVDAVVKQVQTLTYASSRFGTVSYLKAAEKLVEIAPKGLARVNIKMCDGSDANETAVKIARKHTGKTGIISFLHGHTGQTTQTIQLRGYGRDPRTLAGNTEDIIFVNPPMCVEVGDYRHTIDEVLRVIQERGNIAGILIDPVMVNAGVLVSNETKDYLQALNQLANEHGILFMLDENQSFGWLPGMFATNHYDLTPDIITLGKGLSGGHPLAGVLVKEELKAVLDYNEADFTHGGHAISCAAAFASLSMLQSEDFEIGEKEELLKERLEKLQQLSSVACRIRGVGLIYGIEFEDVQQMTGNQLAEALFNESLNDGLFLRRYNNKLVIKPPVIVTLEQINVAFDIFERVLERVTK